MTAPIKPTDPRLDAIVDLLLGYPDGLTTEAVMAKLALSYWVTRSLTNHLTKVSRIASACVGHGKVVWAMPRHAAAIQRRVRAEARVRAVERKRGQRAAAKPLVSAPRVKLWDRDDAWFDGVPDLPTVQRTNTCWAPVCQAPGPTSVFDWARHA